MKKRAALGLMVVAVVLSIILGWPWSHTFSTYTWPGPFGWISTNTPGNVVAGFLQVGLGFLLGYGAKRTGILDRAKDWAMRDLHEKLDEAHAKLNHVIDFHPDIPPFPKETK